MKKQEILDLLELTELPAPGQPGKGKCAALVQRTTGQQDYVITKGGGIITDIGYKSAIVKIIEFYPVVKETVPEKAEVVEVVEQQKPIPQQEPVKKQKTAFNRYEAITFLESKNFNKKSLLKKSDKQLQELLDGFK